MHIILSCVSSTIPRPSSIALPRSLSKLGVSARFVRLPGPWSIRVQLPRRHADRAEIYPEAILAGMIQLARSIGSGEYMMRGFPGKSHEIYSTLPILPRFQPQILWGIPLKIKISRRESIVSISWAWITEFMKRAGGKFPEKILYGTHERILLDSLSEFLALPGNYKLRFSFEPLPEAG